MKDSIKLGELIVGEAQRDAVHVAIAPVVAAHVMLPGTRVGLVSDGTASNFAQPYIGVVDPFLKDVVLNEQKFWLSPSPACGISGSILRLMAKLRRQNPLLRLKRRNLS